MHGWMDGWMDGVPVTFSWLNKHYLFLILLHYFIFYINNVINILCIKAKYESHQVF